MPGSRIVAVALALLVTACGSPPPAPSPPPPTPSPVQHAADRLVAAGSAGAVVHLLDGEKVWQAAAGVADTGVALRPDHHFRIASITKTFTAALVLRQVREGRLALTDRLGGLLPGVLPGAAEATVADLLRHTSGIPDYLTGKRFTQAMERGEHARAWPPGRLVSYAGEPGAVGRYAYSNTNYILLGLILEKATGRAYAELLREHLTTPLGLKATELPTRLLPEGLAHGRDGDSEGSTRVHASIFWSAGGLVSTASDVGAFYRALFGGTLAEGAAMRGGGVELRDEVSGYGVFTKVLGCGIRVFTHSGLLLGYSGAAVSTEDGRRVAVVQLTSSSSPAAVAAAENLVCEA